jgi:hypothetical protein
MSEPGRASFRVQIREGRHCVCTPAGFVRAESGVSKIASKNRRRSSCCGPSIMAADHFVHELDADLREREDRVRREVLVGLQLAEIGQHLAPSPAGAAGCLPAVKVIRHGTNGDLAVGRGTAPMARPRQSRSGSCRSVRRASSLGQRKSSSPMARIGFGI